MAKSEFAQAYTERMFPDIASPAGYIDPELKIYLKTLPFTRPLQRMAVM